MARYARKLTKEELIVGGITNITEDGRVWKHGIEITEFPLNKQGYKYIYIYDRDENGCYIKIPRKTKTGKDSYIYKSRSITVNRAMLAWFNGEIKDGLVADHINNIRDDYNIDNLQPITPGQNIAKERDNWNVKEMKCNMKKPREFYEQKLEFYLDRYDKAKELKDKEFAHKCRTSISHTRARLRYWDSHQKEYEENMEELKRNTEEKKLWKQNVKDRKLLAEYKDMFKEAGNTAMWRQMCRVIKAWDTLNSIQKEHVFETLHKFFGSDVNFKKEF